MPFRLKVSLWILAVLLATVLVGPLVFPVPPLEGTVPVRDLAWPESVWLPAHGLDVHVEVRQGGVPVVDLTGLDAATGPAVVLLHGFGASTRSWASTLPWITDPAVAAPWGVAFDRPGFGLTERPLGRWPADENPYGPEAQVATTIALLDALGAERAVLVGHSAGGAIALEVALAHPERVAGLILVAPAVYEGGGAPAWSKPLLRTPQADRVGPLLMRQLGGSSGEDFLRASWFDPEAIDETTWEAYRRPLMANDWDRALWELVKASREPQLVERLGEVRVPVLVVTGAQDRVVPATSSRDLRDDLTGVPGGAAFAMLEGCGHLPHEECPDAFEAAVTDWWSDRLRE